MSGKSPGAEAAAGAAWIYGRMLVVQLTSLLAIAILARQLDVRAFGLVALANVVITFLNVVAAQGANQFIIYDREEGHEERAKAAFWLNLAISLAAVAAGALVAVPVSRFFREPQLASIILVLLLRFPLEAATRIPDAILHKRLHFKSIEIRDSAVQVASGGAGVAMAYAGFGVWSLVVPSLALAPFQAAVAYAASGWRPGWELRIRMWPRIFSYTRGVIGGTFTAFIITEGDTLLVGRLMGSAQLGVYNLAWRTSNLATRVIVNPSNKLAFPLLAAAAGNRELMAETLRRMLKLVSAITFPLLIGLFVVADDFVHVVYGPKWADAVLPLRILIVYAIRYSVGSPLGPVLNALGRPDLPFKLGLATVPFYCLAIWTGSAYGIVGVAAGVTLVRTIFGSVTLWLVARLLKVASSYLAKPMVSPLAAASLMGAAVLGAEQLWDRSGAASGVLKLAVLSSVGGAAYLLLIQYWFRDIARELGTVLTRLSGRREHMVNRLLRLGSS